MAMTFTTEDEIDALAGSSASSAVTTDMKTAWVNQAEGFLCSFFRYDLVENFDGLADNAKNILSEYAARYAAMNWVLYDMSGWNNRVEPEDIVSAHQQRLRELIRVLDDDRVKTWLKESSEE